jgi:alkanesulfonate monooxygenase SsuD/methylene tetrahydromethanopterin reductase-like flavin-dependent oxidoreductase (luciferase family)
VATAAEAAGATALWACDHLYWSGPCLDALSALTVAATATRSATVGTCVLQLPLRRLPVVAKQVSSLQALSGGRFILGVGVGSHEGEYLAAGVDYHRRGRLLDEALAALPGALSGQADDPGYRLLPAADVPVWVGGASPAAHRRTVAFGTGWIPTFLRPPAYRRGLDQLTAGLEAAGRRHHEVTPAAVVFVRTGARVDHARRAGTGWLASLYRLPPRAFEGHLLAGPAEECAERLAEFEEAGARHLAVMVADDEALEHFEALAEAWRPRPGAADRAAASAPRRPACSLSTAEGVLRSHNQGKVEALP